MRKLTVEEQRRRRFTEAFKREQVLLIVRGASTVSDVVRLYQVKPENVGRWVKKYGQNIALDSGAGIEFEKRKALSKEKEELRKIMEEQQVRIVYMEHLLALAKERLGEDFGE